MKMQDSMFRIALTNDPNDFGVLNNRMHLMQFAQNAVKIAVDCDEFMKWIKEGEEDGPLILNFSVENFTSHIPFSAIMVEFFDMKKMEPCSLTLSDGYTPVQCVGYDLKTQTLIYLNLMNSLIDIKFQDIHKDDIVSVSNMFTLHLVSKYLQTEYVDAVKKTLKVGKKKNKKGKIVQKMSSYILVYRKQPNISNYEAQTPQQIEWQHRWKVKGHWRRIKGIGHGPDGEQLEGFTWVRECIKGPENKPLLNRTRIVKNKLPPNYIMEKT